jgi:serine/threonine-protein kinase
VLVPGSTVDRYVIEGALGQGGMGSVYRAFDTRLRRRVALKVVRGDPSAVTRELTSRMMREARTVAALSHPNVVTIFDVGESEGFPFLAMEMLKGTTLRHAMQDEGTDRLRRLRWLLEIADALAAAHRAGIVHRDVKPENVMVLDAGSVKVLDFGIARVHDLDLLRGATGDPAPQSFRTAGLAGTPKYMAPEQIRGERPDARVDQFAWGLVAYEVLSRRHPRDERPEFSDAAGWSAPARPLADLASDVPPGVVAVVMRALERDAALRWPSMDVLVDALVAAEPALEPLRPQRLPSEAGPEPPPDALISQATTSPVTATQAPTDRAPDARLDRLEARTAPARRRARPAWLIAGAAIAIVAAGAGAYFATRAKPRATAAPSPVAGCTLDDASIVDVEPPLSGYGIMVTDAGAIAAGAVSRGPNDLESQLEYAAVARLPPGRAEPRLPRMDGVGSSIAVPTQGSEPLVAFYINNPSGGVFGVADTIASDGGLSLGRKSGLILTPFGVRGLLARAQGNVVFAAAAVDLVTKSDTRQVAGAGTVENESVSMVASFVFGPGPPAMAKGVLAHHGLLMSLAATPSRAAALIGDGPDLLVAYFDIAAQPLGVPLVVAQTPSDEGTLAFVGNDVVVVWREPTTARAVAHWEATRVGTAAGPRRAVPGTDDAHAPDLVQVDDGLAAVWVQRTPAGSELRFSAGADVFDLPRASVLLRRTDDPLAEPRLAVAGSERWVIWREGRGTRVRAGRIRCP